MLKKRLNIILLLSIFTLFFKIQPSLAIKYSLTFSPKWQFGGYSSGSNLFHSVWGRDNGQYIMGNYNYRTCWTSNSTAVQNYCKQHPEGATTTTPNCYGWYCSCTCKTRYKYFYPIILKETKIRHDPDISSYALKMVAGNLNINIHLTGNETKLIFWYRYTQDLIPDGNSVPIDRTHFFRIIVNGNTLVAQPHYNNGYLTMSPYNEWRQVEYDLTNVGAEDLNIRVITSGNLISFIDGMRLITDSGEVIPIDLNPGIKIHDVNISKNSSFIGESIPDKVDVNLEQPSVDLDILQVANTYWFFKSFSSDKSDAYEIYNKAFSHITNTGTNSTWIYNFTIKSSSGNEIYSTSNTFSYNNQTLSIPIPENIRNIIKNTPDTYLFNIQISSSDDLCFGDKCTVEKKFNYTVKDVNPVISIEGPGVIDVSQQDSVEYNINTGLDVNNSPYHTGNVIYSIPEMGITNSTVSDGKIHVNLSNPIENTYHLKATVCIEELPNKCKHAEKTFKLVIPRPTVTINCPSKVFVGQDITCSANVTVPYGISHLSWFVDGKEIIKSKDNSTFTYQVNSTKGNHVIKAEVSIENFPSYTNSASSYVSVTTPQIALDVNCQPVTDWLTLWNNKKICSIQDNNGQIYIRLTTNTQELTPKIEVKDLESNNTIKVIHPHNNELSLKLSDLNLNPLLLHLKSAITVQS